MKMTQHRILLVSKTMTLHSGKNLHHSTEFQEAPCIETINLDISHVCVCIGERISFFSKTFSECECVCENDVLQEMEK